MKKLMKWLLRLILVVVVLVVVAAVVLPMVIDPNDYKDTIESQVEQQIGRQAHLNGEIEWSVFPWLALTFNDVTVDNDKGFTAKHLATIQQASARVKLLPLISREIQVGRVTIDGAEINLQVAKNGRSNWQGILEHMESNASQSTDTQSSETTSSGISSLDIAGVSLSEIALNYEDAQANTTVHLKDMAMKIGRINANTATDIEASMHINVPKSGLDTDFSTDIVAEHLLDDQGIVVQVNDLTLAGKMSTESVMPLRINLAKKGQVNLANDTLSLPEIVISLGDANINTNLKGANITKKMALSGSYQLSAFDLNAFVKDLTGAPAVSTDVLSNFSSQGSWSMKGSGLKIADLNIAFDDTVVKGKADIKNLEKMAGTFDVHVNQLNVDDFLGSEETAEKSSSDSNSGASALTFGRLNGNVKIDTLTASGASMQNVNVEVKTNNTKMSLVPVRADFYQGSLMTEVQVDTAAKDNMVQVNHKMAKIQAGPLITDLAGSEMLTGIGNLDIDVNIDEPFSDQPLKTAHGRIQYKLGDGAIYGVDVFGMMQKGLGMLYPEVKDDVDDGEVKKTTFALMELDAEINEGIMKTSVLSIESPYLNVNGDVTIDLANMTIKGTIEPMLLDIPDQLVSDKYKKLLNLPIPVSLKGSLLEPEISIDAKKLLLASQKERIDKEKDKLKGKLLDSLFGKDKKKKSEDTDQSDAEQQGGNQQGSKNKTSDKDQLKKDLLKGLFGSDDDDDNN